MSDKTIWEAGISSFQMIPEGGETRDNLLFSLKASHALDVKMWEMFDFGHVLSQKELKGTFQNLTKTTEEPTLRLTLKVFMAVRR